MALGNHTSIGSTFGDERFDCLHTGAFGRKWDVGVAREIPYSFATSKDSYVTSFQDNYGFGEIHSTATFTEFTAGQKTATRAAVARWEELLDVTFVEVAHDEGWIMFGKTNDPIQGRTTAWAYNPAGNHQAGDVWVATGGSVDAGGTNPGQFFHFAMLHEIGHALGAKHPHDSGGGYEMADNDTRDYIWHSVMSYKSTSDGDPDNAYSTADGHFPQTPMLWDVYVNQQWYGVNPNLSAGDVYSWDETTGATKKNGSTLWTPHVNRVLMCLYHPDGLVNLENYASPTLDLTEGNYTILASGQVANSMPGSVQIAFGSSLAEEGSPAFTGRIAGGLGLRI